MQRISLFGMNGVSDTDAYAANSVAHWFIVATTKRMNKDSIPDNSNIKQIVGIYSKSLATWQNLPKFKTCLTFDSTALLLPFHSTNTGTSTERCDTEEEIPAGVCRPSGRIQPAEAAEPFREAPALGVLGGEGAAYGAMTADARRVRKR
ncbi:hypothetical protein MJG53_019042 [Ovis ammon polii x Ovis aries]|uniref:Uncharacterized protein n=1 Tax=Ovis ammon polii x Ovis aries TaxID=2918886 RepID=A0ACB9U3W4_9CETA|nr:hypothetical protein MJG53_019042 [Ovis ammon polii x Ovis aries]